MTARSEVTAYIGLGANLGDPVQALRCASWSNASRYTDGLVVALDSTTRPLEAINSQA